MLVSLLVLTTIVTNIVGDVCNTREVEYGYVCVCDSNYCDDIPDLETLSFGKYQLYSTSKTTLGHNSELGYFSTNKVESHIISVGRSKYQKIFGFGGAFTDATGINIRSLPEAAQQKLLNSYFGTKGIGYSLCRVPIGGADFSPRAYSYVDDPDDAELSHFELQEEDLHNKIPFIQEAKKLLQNTPLKLFASAWTAPPWMKTNQVWTGYSYLKEENYQLWADYTVKFFDEYKKYDIDFWGMTTGNEPMDGFFANSYSKINAMGWIPQLQAQWIQQNLGPALANSSHNIKIIIHDDNRLTMPYVVPLMLNNEDTLKYVDGVAVHWYRDDQTPPEALKLAETDKKDIFVLMSEACFFIEGVQLGSWERAAGYIASIMEYLENGAVGWVDWNMALNLTGGPTYISYEADSPIIVNSSSQEFYKQPMFYAIGHFSKFVLPDSVRLDVNYTVPEGANLKSLAFLRPDDLLALIVYNSGSNSVTVQIENGGSYSESLELEANSLTTVLFPLEDTNEVK